MVGDLARQLRAELEQAPEMVALQSEVVEPLLAGESKVVATGAGDSYVVALAASALTSARAVDPLEAISHARRLVREGYTLLALSVGGRTRSVVEAARYWKSLGGRVVAVTADTRSPLARSGDAVVKLVYGSLAAGIGALRHLVMVAAVASLFGERIARVQAPRTRCPDTMERLVYVGIVDSYSSAVFSALKSYEVFCSPSRYEHLEQLVHAPIYSVSQTPIIVYDSMLAPRQLVERIIKTLADVGYTVVRVEPAGPGWLNPLGQQYWLLSCLASYVEERGVSRPCYREHPFLDELTRLIYYG